MITDMQFIYKYKGRNQDFWLEVKNRFVNFITQIGPNILYALVALVLGVFAIKFTMRLLKRVLRKSNAELSLKTFIESLSFYMDCCLHLLVQF